MRGIAILMVLAVHTPLPIGFGRLARLLSAGTYGVDLFFVLSGYLISGLLFAELAKAGRIRLGRFWLRRGFKIWPSYYVAYVPVFAFSVMRGGTQSPGRSWPNLVFLQNYIHPDARWFASWSVAIEEHFYLVLPPLLLMLFVFRRPKMVPVLCVAVCILTLAIRLWAHGRVSLDLIYLQTHYRMDALSCGVLLGYLQRFQPGLFARISKHTTMAVLASSAALALAVAFPWGAGVTETIGLTLLYLGFALVVAVAAARPHNSTVIGKVLAVIGTYSYTIYLAQAVALVAANLLSRRVHAPAWAVFITCSLVIGVSLSLLIERPLLALRDRVLA